MLYTSYFANVRNLPNTITPIGIVAFKPSWFHGKNAKGLAPDETLLLTYKRGNCSTQQYTEQYLAMLAQYNPTSVYQQLTAQAAGDIALCCYETPDKF